MSVFFSTEQDGRLRVDLDALEGWEGFERLAELFCKAFDAKILERNDGPDARSWVLAIDDHEILLQHDDLLGHFFYGRSPAENQLVRKLGEALPEHLPG